MIDTNVLGVENANQPPPSPRSPYELNEAEVLGRSDHATTYAGYDVSMKRPVAIKVLRPECTMVQRLLAGARISGSGSHGNVVQVFDVDDARRWIVMERMQRSVADDLRKGTQSEERITAIAKAVLGGLSHLHSDNKLHYAVRPENVLSDHSGRIKLADARGFAFDDQLYAPSDKEEFVAPEILNPARFGKPGAESDLFCVGLLLAKLLIGRSFAKLKRGSSVALPNSGHGNLHWIASTESIPDLRSFAPKASDELIELTNRLLKKRVVERIASAEEALAALDVSSPVAPPKQFPSKAAVVTRINAPQGPGEAAVVTSAPDGSVRLGSTELVAKSKWNISLGELGDMLRHPKVVVAIAAVLFLIVVLAGNRNKRVALPPPPPPSPDRLVRTHTTTVSVFPMNAEIIVPEHFPGEQETITEDGRKQLVVTRQTVAEMQRQLSALQTQAELQAGTETRSGVTNLDARIAELQQQIDVLDEAFEVSAPGYYTQRFQLNANRLKYDIDLIAERQARFIVLGEEDIPLLDAAVKFTEDSQDFMLRANRDGEFVHVTRPEFQKGKVRVYLAGYAPFNRAVTLDSLTETIEIKLQKIVVKQPAPQPDPGVPFRINSEPMGAVIFVDGNSRGVTPLTLQLPAGVHEIQLRLDEYENQRHNVKIVPNGVYTTELRPLPDHRSDY